eukprot:TRINITY_DN2659_c0_g2_i2.p1 TRINITY_DN2659_c0_g2~~TRINITY_DN2659_c0_g2_i2.p1  ORF type:complete len:210 (-),score=57.50 TRINITY_DN2659_c0_g2_i2:83-712(-)
MGDNAVLFSGGSGLAGRRTLSSGSLKIIDNAFQFMACAACGDLEGVRSAIAYNCPRADDNFRVSVAMVAAANGQMSVLYLLAKQYGNLRTPEDGNLFGLRTVLETTWVQHTHIEEGTQCYLPNWAFKGLKYSNSAEEHAIEVPGGANFRDIAKIFGHESKFLDFNEEELKLSETDQLKLEIETLKQALKSKDKEIAKLKEKVKEFLPSA